MSSAADIADAASAVQAHLTTVETELVKQHGSIPEWFLDLRVSIHGLVEAGAWATGHTDGVAIVGWRCEGGNHSAECIAYRAAASGFDKPDLPICPRCRKPVHALYSEEIPVCFSCWSARRPAPLDDK